MYKKIRELWKKPKKNMKPLVGERLIKWRRETRFQKLERPTRIDRARSLGYKAKEGFVIVRARIGRGGRKRPHYKRKARKPSKSGVVDFTTKQSLQAIAEARVARKYPNLEVLGSYLVAEDGQHKWFECILVDPNNPIIKKDTKIKWISEPKNRRRVFRGLTTSGKRGRGLM